MIDSLGVNDSPGVILGCCRSCTRCIRLAHLNRYILELSALKILIKVHIGLFGPTTLVDLKMALIILLMLSRGLIIFHALHTTGTPTSPRRLQMMAFISWGQPR